MSSKVFRESVIDTIPKNIGMYIERQYEREREREREGKRQNGIVDSIKYFSGQLRSFQYVLFV